MAALSSPLQSRILAQLRRRFGEGEAVGERLNEVEIAEWLGISRTPVRQVLRSLEEEGILLYEPRRGFQIVRPLDGEHSAQTETAPAHLDERVLRDMALGNLSQVASERALMGRYGVGRGELVSTLRVLMRDQLVEPSPGRGWIFADVGPEALKDGYRFRQIVEPAAVLADGFAVDTTKLERLDREHESALSGIASADRRTLFDLDARFHLMVAEAAGTRALVDAIHRQNNIRRVNEYIGFIRMERIEQSMREHRAIMAAFREERLQTAAALLRMHLDVSQDETFRHLDADLDRLRTDAAGSVFLPVRP